MKMKMFAALIAGATLLSLTVSAASDVDKRPKRRAGFQGSNGHARQGHSARPPQQG